ncbi:MAG: acyltransferase 3 [Bacteroidetes bacterium]|nr:acyltransferase 3 [Bacteroidota bacterium]
MRNVFYIRGLDGLRFLGSFLVLWHHSAKGKELFGYPSNFMFTKGLGHTAMTLFFTLSGFLIIYILLNEKGNTGDINLPKFYKRRITRIWPLYYFLIFLSIFFFDGCALFYEPGHIPINYALATPIYLLQMPNLHIFFENARLVALGHLWTIGVEEQFYAISPMIIKKTKQIVKALVIIVLIKFCIMAIIGLAIKILPLQPPQLKSIKVLGHFLYNLRFEAFAVGGLGAYCFLEKKDTILAFMNKPIIKYSNLIFLLLTMGFGNMSQTFHVVYAASFTIIIINLATRDEPVFFLDNRYVKYLGQISYGIYMYQLPVIYLVLNLLRPYYSEENVVVWNMVYYPSCIVLSIVVSIVSYELVERKIMGLARK